jgi:hypothetical protein
MIAKRDIGLYTITMKSSPGWLLSPKGLPLKIPFLNGKAKRQERVVFSVPIDKRNNSDNMI